MPALSRRKRVSIGIPSRKKREHGAHHHHRRDRSSSRNRAERNPAGKKEVPVGFAEDQVPLKVLLPPTRDNTVNNTDTSNLLTMDEEVLREILKEKKLDSSDSTTDDNNKKLNVEEFECGVSIAGSEKQEWSFTLYDFDGHGKITKEDLASLLKSLYDAVGSSINLPQNGTKTLKLRLTISPDNAKVDDTKNNNIKPSRETSKLNKDRDNTKLSSKENRLENMKQNNITKAEHERLASTTPAALSSHTRQVRNNLSPGGTTAAEDKGSTPRCRMSFGEQQELANLVRENMERNLSRARHVRRHHSDQRASRHKPRVTIAADPPTTGTAQESQDRRNYYLDLAGIDNTQTEAAPSPSVPTAHLNTTAPAAMLLHIPVVHRDRASHRSPDVAKLRSRSHSARHNSDPNTHTHVTYRSKSHEAHHVVDSCCPVLDRTLEEEDEEEVVVEGKEFCSPRSPRSPCLKPRCSSTPKTHKTRTVSLPAPVPDTASPHHHRRHRHRERNHQLAMQNVAEWIEREHARENMEQDGTAAGATSVQRHEHHHVHEHHHHHHHHHHYHKA